VTTRHQIRGYPPDAFRWAFDDSFAAQRLQASDVGINGLVGVASVISLRPKLRAMLLSQV
jgi:hypothetical protein